MLGEDIVLDNLGGAYLQQYLVLGTFCCCD